MKLQVVDNVESNLHFGAYIILRNADSKCKSEFIFSGGFNPERFSSKPFRPSTQEDISGAVFRVLPPYGYAVQDDILRYFADGK